jgi:hypothetical protein
MSKLRVLASYWQDNKEIKITVKDYETTLKNKNKSEISAIIYHRFHDRYIKLFDYHSSI